MEDSSKIYSLKLFEKIIVDNLKSIMRVPGGWILYHTQVARSGIFIPYNDEFDKTKT